MTDISHLVTQDILEDFVRESNAIEGYTPQEYGPGTRIFDQHLATAEWICSNVGRPETFEPNFIHGRLMLSLLNITEVGIPRNVDVYIGGSAAPSPGMHLRKHLREWHEAIDLYRPEVSSWKPENYAWYLHDLFECIHPYTDGNGRTGRLLLNAVRLSYDLPWLTVHVGKEQQSYYKHIQWFRKHSFRCSEKGLR